MTCLHPKRLLSRLLAALALFWLSFGARADAYGDVGALMQSQSWDAAMSQATQYLKNKPADPQMRFLKGMIERGQNKLGEALSTFKQLTEDYPELPEPHNNLAVVYAAQGRYELALKALEMAIKTKPDYAAAYENLADVHVRLAERAYGRVTRLEPDNQAASQKLKATQTLLKAPAPQ
jgi:tetratricopeptide (TPR) repeat protein